jgi:hypothetical protein
MKPTIRKPNTNIKTKKRLTPEERAGFINEADYTNTERKSVLPVIEREPEQDPKELTRRYKSCNVGMNKIEWEILEKACQTTGQSKKAFFRTAMLMEAKSILQ